MMLHELEHLPSHNHTQSAPVCLLSALTGHRTHADGCPLSGGKADLGPDAVELEPHKLKRESEIESAPGEAARLHTNLAEIYRKKVGGLKQALSNPETRSEATEILGGLFGRVAIVATQDGFTIERVGEIANMVRLSGGPEAGKLGHYRSSVKVVAGVGF
jgi:hypothetical protein